MYNPGYRLLSYLNITFIDHEEKNIVNDMKRKYDIAFVCFSNFFNLISFLVNGSSVAVCFNASNFLFNLSV